MDMSIKHNLVNVFHVQDYIIVIDVPLQAVLYVIMELLQMQGVTVDKFMFVLFLINIKDLR